MGCARSTYGERRYEYRVLVGNPEGKKLVKNPGIKGRIILKWIFRNWDEGMDSIDMAQNRDGRRPVVNAVMNFWVP
jgi:hypothetical protein